ncbi:hypothetical protein M3Y96_00873200 [Aphelenchoides besseyi]|nr:hypothetical protein M3Y96_00873200 [Aphelenchoides besseyi]
MDRRSLTITVFYSYVLLTSVIGVSSANKLINKVTRSLHQINYIIPHQYDRIEFDCDKRAEILAWILPNGSLIQTNKTQTESPFNRTNVFMQNKKLVIPEFQLDMNGLYACYLENKQIVYYYVPYVVTHFDFLRALVLSVWFSFIFGLAFSIVIVCSGFCARANRRVKPSLESVNDDERFRMFS